MNDSTATAIAFTGTDIYDTDGYHDPGGANPSRLTVPTGRAGYYIASATCYFASDTDGARILTLVLGGTTAVAVQSTVLVASMNNARLCVSAVLHLDAADFLEAFVWHNAGAALSVLGNITPDELSARPRFGLQLLAAD